MPGGTRAVMGKIQRVLCGSGEIVTSNSCFFQLIAQHWNHAESLYLIQIVDNLAGSLGRILGF